MARRSAVDDGPAALEETWEPRKQPPKKSWGGGGGRWWIWVGRALLWLFVLVVIVNGIRAPFERFTAETPTVTTSGPGKPGFPTAQGSAYALQFAEIYLNYDQAGSADRIEQLNRFLPEGTDSQFGWNGVGQLSASSLQVSSVDAKDANNAIVDIVAKLGKRWVTLAVPVYTKDGAFVISRPPALLEAPPRAALPQNGGTDHDQELETLLKTQLAGFFTAYGNSDEVNLSRYTDGDIAGLDSAVVFSAIIDVDAPKGSSDERTVIATVEWKVPPTQPRGTEGRLTMPYELVVVKKSDQWNVRSIRGASQAGN